MTFENELGKLLTPQIINEIKMRGPPDNGLIFWGGDDDYAHFERELEELIIKNQGHQYGIKPRNFWYIVRSILFKHIKNQKTKSIPHLKIKTIVKDILDNMKIKEKNFRLIYELHNINAPQMKIEIKSVKIGKLTDFLSKKNINIVGKRFKNSKKNAFAKITIKIPNEDLALNEGYNQIETTLDALLSGVPRLRENIGDYECVSVGEHVFIYTNSIEKGKVIIHRRPLIKGYPITITDKLWRCPDSSRYYAPTHPWTSGKLSKDLKDLLWISYCQLGRAFRKISYPDDAIIYGVSSLDLILSPKNQSSKHQALANYLIIWGISDYSSLDPEILFRAFNIRNNVLHEGLRLKWSKRDTENMLIRLYSFLDLTTFILNQSKCQNKEDFLEYLKNNASKYDVKRISEDWYNRIIQLMRNSKSKTYRESIAPTLNMWKEVIKILKKYS